MKTSDDGGGKLFGFRSSQSGVSATYDRHVWLGLDGRLTFGNAQGIARRTVGGARSPVVADGQWPGATGVDRYLRGSMDEVAVYNDELSADAVAGHHRAAVG